MSLREKYARRSGTRMTLRFAYASVAHVIATFFGFGVLRPASGTWGTLGGLLFFMGVDPFVPPAFWPVAVVACLVVGAWAARRTGEDIGVHDHGSIVIDEVFAIWMVLACVPDELPWRIAAFVAFRFFDVVKVPPARFIDERCRNGWGVMLDDAVAGAYAIAVLLAARPLLASGL